MTGKISLAGISTRAPEDVDKAQTKDALKDVLAEVAGLQNLLYANRKHSMLLILQGMDASGKDGAISDIFREVNPQGVKIQSFKVPTEEELSHDFLWRIHRHAPEKGMIQVFNRSHYEDILVTRVKHIIDEDAAKKRMHAINHFEQLLTDNNTHIIKCYLHVSAERQKERIEERRTMPEKMWKYNAGDLDVVSQRDEYIACYEDAFEHCNVVPWHIIPADQNWYKSYSIAVLLRDTFKALDMHYPSLKA
jgi:PPK2 family polyphosphate:nucleotide phosphotransferase